MLRKRHHHHRHRHHRGGGLIGVIAHIVAAPSNTHKTYHTTHKSSATTKKSSYTTSKPSYTTSITPIKNPEIPKITPPEPEGIILPPVPPIQHAPKDYSGKIPLF